MRKWYVIVLALVMAVSFGLSAWAAEVQKGQIIPEFMVKDLNGNDVKISDFRGQYVLFDVWATWCGPCKKAMKSYIQNYSRFEKAGIRIVAISVDSKPELAADYAKKENLPFTVLHDSNKATKEHWGVTGIPTMFLVDPQGKVLIKEIGFDDFAGLWKEIGTVMNVSKYDNFVYPQLKLGTYQAQAAKIDWSTLSSNMTLSFVSSEEFDFVDKCSVSLAKEPKYANKPVYGVIQANGKFFVMAGVDTKKSGYMDLLYVDFNRNLDLTDDKPIEMPLYGNYTEIEFPLDVNVSSGTTPYLVTAYSYNKENKFYLTTAIGYQATIPTDGKAMKVMVIDSNANGRFDNTNDVILMDIDGNGIFDSFSAVREYNALGTVLKLGNTSYKIKFDMATKKIIIERP